MIAPTAVETVRLRRAALVRAPTPGQRARDLNGHRNNERISETPRLPTHDEELTR